MRLKTYYFYKKIVFIQDLLWLFLAYLFTI